VDSVTGTPCAFAPPPAPHNLKIRSTDQEADHSGTIVTNLLLPGSRARSRLLVWALALAAASLALPAAQAQTVQVAQVRNFLLRDADIEAIGAPAASKISANLRREMVSTQASQVPWWLWADGRALMRVLVRSNSPDPSQAELRQAVLTAGGSALMRCVTVRGLSVTVPETGLLALARRAEVAVLSPNRLTTRTFSALEQTAALHGPVPATSVRTYDARTRLQAGLTGASVGIAILDSGLMGTHANFVDADGRWSWQRATTAADLARPCATAPSAHPASSPRRSRWERCTRAARSTAGMTTSRASGLPHRLAATTCRPRASCGPKASRA
jgi:hypothetical protein